MARIDVDVALVFGARWDARRRDLVRRDARRGSIIDVTCATVMVLALVGGLLFG